MSRVWRSQVLKTRVGSSLFAPSGSPTMWLFLRWPLFSKSPSRLLACLWFYWTLGSFNHILVPVWMMSTLSDFPVTDHKAVRFQVPLFTHDPQPTSLICSCPLNTVSAPKFCQAFNTNRKPGNDKVRSVDEPFSVHQHCLWLNEEIRSLKRQCKREERTCIKYRLTTSLASLKNVVFTYQHTIKEARKSYFTDLIANHGDRPRIPFKVVKSVTSPPLSTDKIHFSIIWSLKLKIFVNNYTPT